MSNLIEGNLLARNEDVKGFFLNIAVQTEYSEGEEKLVLDN